jgi:hypothetical protein
VLVGRKNCVNRGGNAFANGSGDNSVVSVVNNQGSGVFNEKCRFLGKDVEKTTVEGGRGGITVHKAVNAGENNRSSNVSSSSVDFKRNIVRTNRGVVGPSNDGVDKGFGNFSGGTFDNFIVDTEERVGVAGGSVDPLIPPEVGQQCVDSGRVVSDTIVSIFKGGD